ncbi:MAG TPA: galactokinase [Anaerolineales bacterium]|nr:galactokinase [Anaerolineales bacterium]
MNLQLLFAERFGHQPEILARAPGRVNLLGEHVDYNDGPVLPAAIDRAVHLASAPSQQNVVHLIAYDLDDEVAFPLDALRDKSDGHGDPLPNWALYPAGVAWALREAGYEVLGVQALYTSDVPIGAGLSSSAAVEAAFAVTWQALGGWQIDRMQLARLCQRAENEYVGVACGLMDQFASLHGVSDHALYFDTRSLEWQALPLPVDNVLVIADSGLSRELSGSVYNQRRAECQQAVQLLQEYLPDLRSLRDVSPTEFAAYSEFLSPTIRKRAEHVVKEIYRVDSAVSALKLGEWRSFGAKMLASHASLRDLYEVSSPELDTLVDIAHDLPGCYGARLTGAGFGGCTVNLVEQSKTREFIAGLQSGYQNRTGRQAKIYSCRASDGARAEIIPN